MHRNLAVLSLLLVLTAIPVAGADEESWFVSFNRIQVQPVARADTSQLELAGTIETDSGATMSLFIYRTR